MGLIQKKDEKDEIDGIQIIERGEGPDGDEDEKIDLVAGTSAEHIAAGTTAEEEDARLEAQIAADAADENLMPEATGRGRRYPGFRRETTMHPSTRRR